MNWFDLTILLILLLYAIHGWRRGILLILLDLATFLVAIGAALIGFRYAGGIFASFGFTRNLANAAAFLAVFVIVQAGLWFAAVAIYKTLPKSARSSPINRLLGVIPAVAKGFLLCSLAAMALVLLPIGLPRNAVLQSAIGSRMLAISSAVERGAASLFSGAVREALTFLTIDPTAKDSIKLRARTTDVDVDYEAEDEMLGMVNKERAARGLRLLRMDPSLRTLARKHSRDMFARGYFSHVDPDGRNPFDRMRQAGIDYDAAGENLAMAPSVEIAHDGLMQSPGHRANILDPDFRRVGIGCCSSDIYGKMFSQEFAN